MTSVRTSAGDDTPPRLAFAVSEIPQNQTESSSSDPEQTTLVRGFISLGRIGTLMAFVLACTGIGLYFVLRHSVKFVGEQPILGGVIWAAVWAWLCYELLKLGVKHREVVLRLGTVGPLALVSATMPAICGLVLLINLAAVANWLRAHEVSGVLLYVAAFATLSGLALLPTYAQALLGGWAFGVGVGLPAAMFGFIGGSAIGFEIARRASGDRVTALIAENARWNAVRAALLGSGFWKTVGVVSLVRLPPNSPFAMTNLALASLGVRRGAFLLGTAIGMLPRTALVVAFAAHMADLIDPVTGKLEKPGWWFAASIGASVVVLVILGQIAKRVLERTTSADGPDEAGSDEAGTGDAKPDEAKPGDAASGGE